MVTWSPPAFGPQHILPDSCNLTDGLPHSPLPSPARTTPGHPAAHPRSEGRGAADILGGYYYLEPGKASGSGACPQGGGSSATSHVIQDPRHTGCHQLVPYKPQSPHPESDTSLLSSPQIIWGHSLLKFLFGNVSLSTQGGQTESHFSSSSVISSQLECLVLSSN